MPTEDTVGVSDDSDTVDVSEETTTPDQNSDADDSGSLDNSSNEQHTDSDDSNVPPPPTPDEGGPDPENENQTTGEEAPPETVDPRINALNERYANLRRSVDGRVGKVTSQNRQLQEELARFRSEHAKREEQERVQKLDPWSKKHPENQAFQSLKTRAKTLRETLRNLEFPEGTPEETMKATKQSIINSLSQDEWTKLNGYEAKIRERSEQMLEDPEAFFEPIAERIAAKVLQQAQQDFKVDHEVEADFNDPNLKPLLDEYANEFGTALKDGVPYHYAVHQMKLFDNMRKMEAKLAKMSKGTVHADAQRRLAKTGASITRDPKPAKTVDVYTMTKKWAAENDVEIGGTRFNQKLLDFEKKFSSG